METGLQPLGMDARGDLGAPLRLVARPSTGLVVLRTTWLGCLSGLGAFSLVEGFSVGTPRAKEWGFILALVPFAFVALFAVLQVVNSRTPGEVTDDAVRLRVGLSRRERVIPLDSVAAVGMVYEILRRPTGWISYLWLEDGEAVPLGLTVWTGNRSDVNDWEKLAATPPGGGVTMIPIKPATCWTPVRRCALRMTFRDG